MGNCCSGSIKEQPAPQTRFKGGGAQKPDRIKVRVYSEADVEREVAARPGYHYTRAYFGPTTSILTFSPKAG